MKRSSDVIAARRLELGDTRQYSIESNSSSLDEPPQQPQPMYHHPFDLGTTSSFAPRPFMSSVTYDHPSDADDSNTASHLTSRQSTSNGPSPPTSAVKQPASNSKPSAQSLPKASPPMKQLPNSPPKSKLPLTRRRPPRGCCSSSTTYRHHPNPPPPRAPAPPASSRQSGCRSRQPRPRAHHPLIKCRRRRTASLRRVPSHLRASRPSSRCLAGSMAHTSHA